MVKDFEGTPITEGIESRENVCDSATHLNSMEFLFRPSRKPERKVERKVVRKVERKVEGKPERKVERKVA